MYLLELAGLSGVGSDKQDRDVRGRSMDGFMFFRIPLDEENSKHVFLSAFLLFWATNPLLGNKNNLKTT